jgi:hypothetical protein
VGAEGLLTMKLTRTILPALFALCLAPLAHGIPSYTPPTLRPPKAVPATQCTLSPYAAFANKADDNTDGYVLSGSCNINVAPATKDPVLQKVKVRVEAEWSPKLKRASERMTIIHPDKTFSFSTWATCFSDPFITGANTTCRDQGMGGDDFSLYLKKEDAPFARDRVPASLLPVLTARATSLANIREQGVIKTIEIPGETSIGKINSTKTTFAGGPGACPMEVDFGDGYIASAYRADQPTFDLMTHVYLKSGYYTVKVRSLPGCYGETSARVHVQ